MKSISEMASALVDGGMSQPKLAELAGTSQPTIWRIIHGRTSRIDYEVAEKIKNIYQKKIIGSQPAQTEAAAN